MKTGFKVALGLLGALFAIPLVGAVVGGTGFRSEPNISAAPEQQSLGARPVRNDIFGPPAPRLPADEQAVSPPIKRAPERAKDKDGYYEIDIPAGLHSSQTLHRMSREVKKLLLDTQDDLAVGWPIRAAIYFTWKGGAKEEIVQMVFTPDTVKQLLNTPAWLNDGAVENIPDLADDKRVISAQGFWQLCKGIALSDNGVQVAGQRFCTY